MGVYLSGMEMPTSCYNCWALDEDGDYPRCRITEEQRGYNFSIREKRMDKCPLVPVPEHGRTIDADVLFKEIGMDGRFGILEAMCIQSIIHDAPTIIPTDPVKEEVG